jgi:DNA-binding NarL/FixJ family response regulator
MNGSFLLVTEKRETRWSIVLQGALAALGTLEIVQEREAVGAIVQKPYDVIIVDAGTVEDAAALTSRLRTEQPEARIIVATASPTWQRAREAMQAGAADYMRKSLDEKELRSKIETVLGRPAPLYGTETNAAE